MKLTNLAILLSLSVAASNSRANLLTNGSFESGTFVQNNSYYTDRMDLAYNSTAITGWVAGVSSGDFAYLWWMRGPTFNAENGNAFVDLDSNGNTPYSYIQQTFNTVIGKQYTVSGFFGSEYNGGVATTLVEINGNKIGTVNTGSATSASSTFGTNIVWTPEQFTFTANSTSTTLRFQDATVLGANGYDNPLIDNVSVNAVVPEGCPTSLIFSLAVGGLAWFGYRQRLTPIC